MSVAAEMFDLLERRRKSRDTTRIDMKATPSAKSTRDDTPTHKRKGFVPGTPRKRGRRPRTDTRVMDFGEAKLSPLAQRLLKHMKKSGAAYGVQALADASKAQPQKVLMALKELEADGKASQDKKSKGWYAEHYDHLSFFLLENWKKTSTGYEGMFGKERAVIHKKGKNWFLDFKGKTYSMPKRASFDHAEGIIAQAK